MLTYHWDGTADTGASVPIGEYVLFLEGTLRGENQVVYRSPILFGYGAASAEVSVEYTGVDATAERSMISNVNVKVLQ
jgi:flagellar hook assembly protein FlgD